MKSSHRLSAKAHVAALLTGLALSPPACWPSRRR